MLPQRTLYRSVHVQLHLIHTMPQYEGVKYEKDNLVGHVELQRFDYA